MKLLLFLTSIFVTSICIYYNNPLRELLNSITVFQTKPIEPIAIISSSTEQQQQQQLPMSSTVNAVKNTMSKAIAHAKIVPRRSTDRGHANHGWLDSYHTFSFANYYDPRYQNFGSLRVLNEDRVDGGTGFPTHPHRDAEIFSYLLSGELTHRDSMIKKGNEGKQGDDFFRMKRGDVQFTTGGTGMSMFSSFIQRQLLTVNSQVSHTPNKTNPTNKSTSSKFGLFHGSVVLLHDTTHKPSMKTSNDKLSSRSSHH